MNLIAQKNETTSYYVEGYNEEVAMSYFSRSALLDPIEGIGQSTDGYKYSIEKDVENGQRLSEKYRVIVLESSSDGWKLGQIRGFITTGSVESVYSFKYYTRNIYDGSDVQSQNIFLIVESPVIMTFSRVDSNGKISMYRIYPKADMTGGYPNAEVRVSQGSGIVIGDKYIATNNHVVDSATTFSIYGINGYVGKSYNARLIITDKRVDLAILMIDDEDFDGFATIPYGHNTTTVDVGTEVIVFGYPYAYAMGNEVKVTNGIISAKTGFNGDVSRYQMSAPIQPGNSGGPVFDYNGNLIGISVSGIRNDIAQNANYAVKLSYLKSLIESCNERIEMPSNNIISSFSLQDKVKAISPFVVMIKSSNGNSSSVSRQSQQNQPPVSINNKQEAEKLKLRSIEKYNKKDEIGAYTDIIESVKLYPTPESHFIRAWLAQNLSLDTDIDIIIESYTYCVEHEYRLEESYYSLARCFHIQCKYNEAIDMYNKALLENKKSVASLYMRALCKSKLGDIQTSIADYMRAVKYEGIVDFDYGTIYNNVAYAYVGLGNYDMAEKYIKEALKRNHLENYIWDTDGELAYKKGDYNRCISSMNNAITIDNKSTNSYYYRGLAKVKLGNHSGAYNDLEILNTIDMAPPKLKFDCVYNEWKEQKKEDSIKANTLKKYIDMSKVDFERLTEDETIISCPKVTNRSADISSVKAVEISSEYTALHMVVLFQQYSGNKNYWVNKDSYIIDKSTYDTLYLLKTENCSIWPETAPANNGRAEFVLYFPAINKNCKEIDFVEPSSNQNSKSWFAKGIRVGETDGILSWEDVFVTDEELAVQDMVYVKTIKKKCAYGAKNSCVNSIRKEAAKENCRVVLITGVNDAEWSTTVTAKLYR